MLTPSMSRSGLYSNDGSTNDEITRLHQLIKLTLKREEKKTQLLLNNQVCLTHSRFV
jgi:hypothetical protein